MNTTLILELSSFCNLNCIMCGLPGMNRNRGFMEKDLLAKILADLNKESLKFNLILPFWSGESVLHPEFKEMISMICNANRDFDIADGLGMDSNMTAFTPETSDLILSVGQFVVIHLSLDAVTAETYQKIRKGGNFEKAVSNSIYLLKEKARLGSKYPNLVFQFIVMEENYNEADSFFRFWKNELDKAGLAFQVNYFYDQPAPIEKDTIFIRRCDAPCGETDRQLHLEKLHSEAIRGILGLEEQGRLIRSSEYREDSNGKNVFSSNNSRPVCSGPFTHLAIRHDGKATLCCQDTEANLAIGDVNKESISRIWFGEKANNLRKAHAEAKLPERCRECFNQVFPLLSGSDLVRIMQDLGLPSHER